MMRVAFVFNEGGRGVTFSVYREPFAWRLYVAGRVWRSRALRVGRPLALLIAIALLIAAGAEAKVQPWCKSHNNPKGCVWKPAPHHQTT